MIRLLKIDFRKYFYNRTFWILTITYLLVMVLVFYGIEHFLNSTLKNAGKNSSIPIPSFSLYSFPYVWQNLSYLAGYFKIFPALIILIFITAEYNYKTIRQNVMNGLSRMEFLMSKVIFVFFYSLLAALVLFFSALTLGFIHTSQEVEYTALENSGFIIAYFLETFAFSTLAMFVGFLVQRSGLAIGTLILYYYIVEPVIDYKLPESISQYMPAKVIRNLIDVPNSSLMKLFGINFREYVATQDIVLCIVYSILFIVFSWLLLKNKDL